MKFCQHSEISNRIQCVSCFHTYNCKLRKRKGLISLIFLLIAAKVIGNYSKPLSQSDYIIRDAQTFPMT